MTQTITAMPAHVLFEKWSEIGFSWQGKLSVADLSRLSKEVDTAVQKNSSTLDVDCVLKKTNGIVWLSFEVSGVLWLMCHRCLSPMIHDVSGSYHMAILTSESQVGALMAHDNQAEYVFLSELGDSRALPILQLLEDELLLTLPLSATHDNCDMLLDSVGDIPNTPKDNPFAVLQHLKLAKE